jgi:hypothetical protein
MAISQRPDLPKVEILGCSMQGLCKTLPSIGYKKGSYTTLEGSTVERIKNVSVYLSNIISALVMTAGLMVVFPVLGHTKEIDLLSVGVRAGVNSRTIGLPPSEKEDFERYDVFAVIGLPWGWEFPSGWDIRFRLNAAAGALRAAGDTGFITELTPGIAFSKPSWRLTFDIGGGWAYLSDYKFGRQNIGGPFQIIGHGGITYHLPWNVSVGWRFHHMSDATIYGTDNRGVDLHMLEVGYRF